jgi:hypothetical protein
LEEFVDGFTQQQGNKKKMFLRKQGWNVDYVQKVKIVFER